MPPLDANCLVDSPLKPLEYYCIKCGSNTSAARSGSMLASNEKPRKSLPLVGVLRIELRSTDYGAEDK